MLLVVLDFFPSLSHLIIKSDLKTECKCKLPASVVLGRRGGSGEIMAGMEWVFDEGLRSPSLIIFTRR